ncbi:glycine betaine ABC transporter substrate-binding protein [Lentibacillus sp. CBA3610]|uniref:glycine betaine ABC transporter substrate-binding protein n=1 Tax=Lentibacillus sp. CBA3610 TaxID=2518176 RepID=UPI0015961F8B|nr:glycine betaine ABC transporter substrate-binding protein [Lentibacillus sp. CBA3610]QKY69966.1 osmoprotectant ABC transporter substrate-binding protein [Lentibacillus sp. CBA3610]
MKKFGIFSALVMFLVVPLAACSGSGTITIGAQTYTETKILAHMYKDLIEQETDLSVEITPDMATSPIVLEGMQGGDIDMSTQFTGTAISSFTDIENPEDSDATLQQAKDFFSGEDFNFTFFDGLGYANTYAFTVREDIADEYDLEQVSDLEGIAGEFSAGFDTAWLERENDGYPAFIDTYNFEFGNTNPMEIGLVYDAVNNGEVDVVLAYSTDPRIVAYDLKILEDDESFFPPYDAAPVVRNDVLDEHPGIADAIEPLIGSFDEETIGDLNGRVDLDGEEIEDVAQDYLEEQGLLE